MHKLAASASRYRALQIATGIFGLALVASTWRLWTPQHVFPQVPLLGFATDAPAALDYLALLTIALGLGWTIVLPRFPRASALCWLYPFGVASAVVLDQHRLQPWAYQIAALAVIFAGSGPYRALTLIRLLTIGIYTWSALGKFDFQFVHTVGTQMIEAMTRATGFPDGTLSQTAVRRAAIALPVGELIVAALLAWSPARRAGVVLAVALHISLIAILGPLGLGHQPGVLLWNGFFAVQAALLFWPTFDAGPDADASREPFRLSAVTIVAAMLLLPALERFGRFDHWPSWALYAPHSSRATVYVTPDALPALPESLVALVDAAEDPQRWVRLPIDRWSLATLGVPIYPQGRFQLGVALALSRDARLDRELRVDLRSTADRYSGLRETETLIGRPALLRAADRFFFSAMPR